MPIYRYSNTVSLKKEEVATLDISFGQAGITAHHIIDLPGPNDKQALDQCTEQLGTVDYLKKERTLIFTKAISINPNATSIDIEYEINGNSVVSHSNLKSDDPSPQIIVTLVFQEI